MCGTGTSLILSILEPEQEALHESKEPAKVGKKKQGA